MKNKNYIVGAILIIVGGIGIVSNILGLEILV